MAYIGVLQVVSAWVSNATRCGIKLTSSNCSCTASYRSTMFRINFSPALVLIVPSCPASCSKDASHAVCLVEMPAWRRLAASTKEGR
uniref:Metallothionein-like protein n=1 Tax=Pyrenopeziza brassicae TaxID=76659 RepID=O93943_PYRBR|nr:metallothionein-like protein [Pyrenopeziza brassicae]